MFSRNGAGPAHQNMRTYKPGEKKAKAANPRTVADGCSEQVKWKLKYGKYKPLTQPRKCDKCLQKTVTKAYAKICTACADKEKLCCKCAEKTDVQKRDQSKYVDPTDPELALDLSYLSERKRRTVYREQITAADLRKLREGREDEVDLSKRIQRNDESDDECKCHGENCSCHLAEKHDDDDDDDDDLDDEDMDDEEDDDEDDQ